MTYLCKKRQMTEIYNFGQIKAIPVLVDIHRPAIDAGYRHQCISVCVYSTFVHDPLVHMYYKKRLKVLSIFAVRSL